MGLLDQVIGSVVGQVLGGGRGHQESGGGNAMSPIVQAILMALIAKGADGGLGNIFGGGQDPRPAPQPAPQGGDLGGFDERGGRAGEPPIGAGQYDDLAGMLDGPGDARSPGQGPYAGLDREPGQAAGGGLDGLIQSFERNGLGDVIGSWIGTGQNKEVAPGRLEDALGRGTVDDISRQTGLGRDELLGQLAQMLPQVIDALTPQGRPPTPEERRGW